MTDLIEPFKLCAADSGLHVREAVVEADQIVPVVLPGP